MKIACAAWVLWHQRWFRWGVVAHVAVFLLLAHVYDAQVFQDASRRLASGQGIYVPFSEWLGKHHDGYYAYPPAYAYMLWISGRLAGAVGHNWWIQQILIKAWMLLADAAVFAFLYRMNPQAGRMYWTLWFVPVVGIAQMQPDLLVGFSVLFAYYLARREQWIAAGLVLAAGIGLKATPLVIVPFLLIYLAQRRWSPCGWQIIGALALGLVVVWLPYIFFFNDAVGFGKVLMFHLIRPAFGLNVVGGLRSAVEYLGAVKAIPESIATGMTSVIQFQLSGVYPVVTLLALAALGMATSASRWSLEQIFTLPLLTFLLANKVVNEQYLLTVMPVLLVVAPTTVGRLVWPLSVYVLAAGTPLRFFPAEYGFPLSPNALLPPIMQGLAPLVDLVFAAATSGAAWLFSYRLYQSIRVQLSEGRTLNASILATPYPEVTG